LRSRSFALSVSCNEILLATKQALPGLRVLAQEKRRLASAPARVHHLYTATKTNELEPYAGDEAEIKLGFKHASEREQK